MKHFIVGLFLVAGVGGCGGLEPQVGTLSQGLGEPMGTFPSPDERLGLMMINRARSDPATVKGPQSEMYPARPPVGWAYDLNRSSRFHATNLSSTQVTLMHDSPCPLNANVAAMNCDGEPNCACSSPVGKACQNCANVAPIGNGCGTATFTRIGYFFQGASGEVAAAGYPDPKAVVDGWMDEAMGEDGHRRNLTDQGTSSNVMGYGRATNMAACWSSFDVSDSGNVNGYVGPLIPTAAVYPSTGAANSSFRFYSTWADPTNGNPGRLSAVVDGICQPMALELGTATLNSTWFVDETLAAGCHTYWILGTDAKNNRTTYPTTGAITISVGGVACNAQYQAMQPGANCEGEGPADLSVGPHPADLSSGSSHDLASNGKVDLAMAAQNPNADLAGADLDYYYTGSSGGCGCTLSGRVPSGLPLTISALLIGLLLRRRRRLR